ncbi:MAG: primosomal protein N', partial [Fibrobacterota bacterium]
TMMALCEWLSAYYMAAPGEVFRHAVPSFARDGETKKKKFYRLSKFTPSPENFRGKKQSECIKLLAGKSEVSASELKDDHGIGTSTLKTLEEGGYIDSVLKDDIRLPFFYAGNTLEKAMELSEEQRGVFDHVMPFLEDGKKGTFLLKGVTGSGKTAVYVKLIREALDKGKSALMLVPEITLSAQTIDFMLRFIDGDDIAVIHSGMTKGERFDIWNEIKSGRRRFVIGVRSAVFAPLDSPGVIIVDEEHSSTYKQSDGGFRYNARDVCVYKGAVSGCPVILGSATPSFESSRNAETGKYFLLELKKRYSGVRMPAVEISDLKKDTGRAPGDSFGDLLERRIEERLVLREQTILLLNRRGYSGFLVCRSCGNIDSCPSCDITLTYHRDGERMLCHICGYSAPRPVRCGKCGSVEVREGTPAIQRVEEEIRKKFKGARTVRLDTDTASKKGNYSRILKSFRNREYDILLGTQMVSKGLDFPGVTLVGVISADTAMSFPDFRAPERTFQMLSQVSGRAGRHGTRGEVIIQTYSPEADPVVFAASHDYNGFYAREMELRKELCYPPFSRMFCIRFISSSENSAMACAVFFADKLRRVSENASSRTVILGPVFSVVKKRKNRFSVVLSAKTSAQTEFRNSALNVLKETAESFRNVEIIFDVDPYDHLY